MYSCPSYNSYCSQYSFSYSCTAVLTVLLAASIVGGMMTETRNSAWRQRQWMTSFLLGVTCTGSLLVCHSTTHRYLPEYTVLTERTLVGQSQGRKKWKLQPLCRGGEVGSQYQSNVLWVKNSKYIVNQAKKLSPLRIYKYVLTQKIWKLFPPYVLNHKKL